MVVSIKFSERIKSTAKKKHKFEKEGFTTTKYELTPVWFSSKWIADELQSGFVFS